MLSVVLFISVACDLSACKVYCHILLSIEKFTNFLFLLFVNLSLAVLEGIAISFNPTYKVLGSTYPWIARKVLTDSSPKLKASLQSLLYEVKPQLISFFFSLPRLL